VEPHKEDVEEGAWRRMWRRIRHRWLCDREMKGLGLRGSGTLKKKNSRDMHDDIINVCRYI
jgi:hypothetical protein